MKTDTLRAMLPTDAEAPKLDDEEHEKEAKTGKDTQEKEKEKEEQAAGKRAMDFEASFGLLIVHIHT